MITAINSATSFKGVYIVEEERMSGNQKKTAYQIKHILKDESKSKDFLLLSEQKTDSVSLSQVFGLKCSKNKMQAGEYIYTNAIKIGAYNIDSFELSDIQKAYNKKEQQKKDNIFVTVGLIILAAYLAFASAFYVKKVIPAKRMYKMELINENKKNDLIKNIK